jgi:hypothetical protein
MPGRRRPPPVRGALYGRGPRSSVRTRAAEELAELGQHAGAQAFLDPLEAIDAARGIPFAGYGLGLAAYKRMPPWTKRMAISPGCRISTAGSHTVC